MTEKKMKQKDWREEYIICEHVAEDQTIVSHTTGFRVCCEECYNKGFLQAVLFKTEQGRLTIGRLEPE